MADKEEYKRGKFMFELFCGGGLIDGFDVINAIRGLHLNPTIELVNSLGGREKRAEVFYTFEEFWKIYLAVKDDDNMGGYEDFVECLKTYDIAENGYMQLSELTHMLLNLGERITENELDEVLTDCMLEPENEDGMVPYLPFLCRLCERPIPEKLKPQ